MSVKRVCLRWHIQEHVLRELARGELAAMQEVQARLLTLYPEYDIAHMASDLMQAAEPQPQPEAGGGAHGGGGNGGGGQDGCGGEGVEEQQRQRQQQDVGGGGDRQSWTADCDQFVANAAVAGDMFAWHIDADPVGAFPNYVRLLRHPLTILESAWCILFSASGPISRFDGHLASVEHAAEH